MQKSKGFSSSLLIICLYFSIQQSAAQANSGMNPAHGAPGHRCDIAVGAPLNTPAAKPAVANIPPGQSFPGMLANPKKANSPNIVASNPAPPVAVQKPAVTVAPGKPVATASTNKATAGLNPAHGQPNHRCDIAVGAPLNSPATKAATNTVQQATPLQSSPVKNTSGAKLNPAHGQPGHDCSVEVGKPLKQ